ncbi:MAG TPA: cytochrome c3 family protein [Candidatus Sulfotelmatobacter sp.]|nr:cytochrome c3 family protein [Candidatus Sulfotelmatobacter sp.]
MKHFFSALGFFVLLAIGVLWIPSRAATTKSTLSIASFAQYVQIPGAKPVGADTCTGCHKAVAQNFQHAFHAQQGVECEQCHGNGSLHVDGGGDVTKIVAFSKRTPEQANGVCLSCHARGEKTRHWISGSHAANHVRCVDCHQIHHTALRAAKGDRISFDQATRGALTAASVSPETNVIVRPMWETNDACLKCHRTEGAQLSMPYHHPLREGKMSCVDCHDPHGGPDGRNLKTSNRNELCLSCHAQYRGPYAYQHPPVTENCMLCHTPHGSPNTSLLTVSVPALCLQCHAGHHDGGSLPLADRCTNCHLSIHGTDVPTPSGGSRFVDKGPSERDLVSGVAVPVGASVAAHANVSMSSMPRLASSHLPTFATGAMGGAFAMLSSRSAAPLSGGAMAGGAGMPPATETEGAASSAFSFTPGEYRFVDGSGFLGRVGQYDSLEQSAGADISEAYVSTRNNLTVVSRGNVLSGDDYSAATQLTAGEWAQVGLFIRSFLQQQENYPFYAFPALDLQVPGGPTALPNCQPSFDCTTISIPSQAVFGVTRRIGNAYARFKVPKLPVRLFVNGDWQARAGVTQLSYLDENSFVPIPGFTQACGAQCHFQSQFQPTNYTTRNVGGGAQVDLGQFQLTWEHTFSSFNDRLQFPIGTFTGPFLPEADSFGYSSAFPPPKGPTPGDVAGGNYFIAPTSPSQASTDRLGLNWTVSPDLTFNGNVSYMRLRDTYTHYPQNSFDTDETANWRPINRLRLTADYHQQNVLNNFTPYYSLFGNVSFHNHEAGVKLDYELPKGFDVEGYYKRSGITRSNASLWPQAYSVDNTDLLTVVPSSFSNTTGLALRYHDRNYWSARAGYEWTGTHHPGYLIVPQSNNRTFVNLWLTPTKWLVLSNDVDVTVQNAFPDVPLPNTPGVLPLPPPATQSFGLNIAGLPPTFQRRSRFYTETLSANFRLVPDWNFGLGYSYQQNNFTSYMAFQNDSAAGYILDEPNVPYKQITQAYWGESSYTFEKRLGLNLRVTYNSARSGWRPDVNPADAASLGNQYLISTGAFNQAFFGTPGQPLCPSALCNLQISATQVSEVIVPEWIGQGKVYYLFPRKFEGGFVFYYGSYRDYWNPNLNGVLRTAMLYVGKSW